MKSQYKRAALFALFLMLAATGSLSAFAASPPDGPATARAGYHHANSRLRLSHPGYSGQADAHMRLAPNRHVLDDACDLPSTGCESYLAN
jgi:hypothetical protein